MHNENNLQELSFLLDKLDYPLPPILYFKWNHMDKVRPCLEMLVWVLMNETKKLCYLDVIEDVPFWVDVDGNKFEYELVQQWMPMSSRYMEGVILGELLKINHDKTHRPAENAKLG